MPAPTLKQSNALLQINAQFEPGAPVVPPAPPNPPRFRGVSYVLLTGTDLDPATATVSVLDSGGAGYDFDTDVIKTKSTQKRLLVKLFCKNKPVTPVKFTTLQFIVTTTAGGASAPIDEVVMLKTRSVPVIDHSRLPKVRLVLENSRKKVVLIPGANLADPDGDVTALVNVVGMTTAGTTVTKGRWSASAKQKKKGVRVVLTCEDAASSVPYSAVSGSSILPSCLLISLSPDDETTIDVPPIDVEFNDPDEDPVP